MKSQDDNNTSPQDNRRVDDKSLARAQHRRRRGGRFGRIALMAGAVAGVLTLGACGQRGWSHGDDPQAKIEHVVDRMFSKVDATDEQKARISEIAAAAFVEIKPMREQMRDSRKVALAALTGDNVDRAKLEALRAERLSDMDKGSMVVSKAIADIAEVLTPEQRAIARERIGKKMDKHGHRGRWFN